VEERVIKEQEMEIKEEIVVAMVIKEQVPMIPKQNRPRPLTLLNLIPNPNQLSLLIPRSAGILRTMMGMDL
jgi:hypothetical protein